jgi:hypothetical protein
MLEVRNADWESTTHPSTGVAIVYDGNDRTAMNATGRGLDRYAAVALRTETVAAPVAEGREKAHSSEAANLSSVTLGARV